MIILLPDACTNVYKCIIIMCRIQIGSPPSLESALEDKPLNFM